MPETDAARETRAAELARENEAAAIVLAEKRGQEQARLEGAIQSHEQRLSAINGSIERSASAQRGMVSELAALSARFDKKAGEDQVRAEAATEAAAKQVDKRTFVLGLVGAVGVLSAILGTIVVLLQGSGHG